MYNTTEHFIVENLQLFRVDEFEIGGMKYYKCGIFEKQNMGMGAGTLDC